MAVQEWEVPVEIDPSENEFTKKAPGILGRSAVLLKAAFNPVTIAVVAVVGFAGKSISAWKKQEKSINALNQSLIKQGIFTQKLSKQYQDLALALQMETTFADESIIQAQSSLQNFIGAQEISQDLMRSILDFSAGMNVDLNTAVRLVGQSVSSSTNALSRYGIEIDTNASKQEKMKQIMEALTEKHGGQAKAQAKGLGSLKQLWNVVGGLFEMFGRAMAPAIVFFANQLKNGIVALQNSKQFFTRMGEFVDGISAGGILLKMVVTSVVETLATALATSVAVMGNVIKGRFKRAAMVAQDGVLTALEDLKKQREIAGEQIGGIIDERTKAGARDSLLEAEKQATRSLAAKLRAKKRGDADRAKGKVRFKKGQKELSEIQFGAQLGSDREFFKQMGSMQSKQKALMAASKTAALISLNVDTVQSVINTFAWFSRIPLFGTLLAAIASLAILAYSAEQSAKIAGAKMSEGGIATGGSVQPLPRDFALQRRINVTIDGGLSGTDEEIETIIGLIQREAA
jgi:hypothetical protein